MFQQVLATKMTVLYKLAKEQLSKQHHYDFGLRALKSVLVMAGELKRGSPDLTEDIVLMRALRDMNMPKLVSINGTTHNKVTVRIDYTETDTEICTLFTLFSPLFLGKILGPGLLRC